MAHSVTDHTLSVQEVWLAGARRNDDRLSPGWKLEATWALGFL